MEGHHKDQLIEIRASKEEESDAGSSCLHFYVIRFRESQLAEAIYWAQQFASNRDLSFDNDDARQFSMQCIYAAFYASNYAQGGQSC